MMTPVHPEGPPPDYPDPLPYWALLLLIAIILAGTLALGLILTLASAARRDR